ncbi:hypothetical protein BC939DRAFT_150413 [Gamsiella multidivaricata]|uniref:uncharacterized protein n=1 Tax=Gamsiella multidivaricata TaxID=101098 RepID=UPI00221E53EF|nr:uncharacterized protein BC939DRAFT_150413 [Gamsiella multidivaricata]KAI7831803.1 hypothetical protein BC939DRAFT_150413 [Gamsiella multidivaricata]
MLESKAVNWRGVVIRYCVLFFFFFFFFIVKNERVYQIDLFGAKLPKTQRFKRLFFFFSFFFFGHWYQYKCDGKRRIRRVCMVLWYFLIAIIIQC